MGVFPLDIHNAVLLDNVSPMDWKNPEQPDDFVYDVVAIGGGAGGLVTSEEANARGFKAALIEKHMNGGDCLNVGCVPSKALLRSAKAIREARQCAELGVEVNFQSVNFGKIMERMRARRAEIAPVDSFQGAQNRGTDMYFGEARFSGRNSLTVAGKTLNFRKAVIATGGSALVPPIPGLEGTPFLTNASLYNLTELPKSMLIIGAGPIGSEMAQAFSLFGSKVTVVADAFLPREDASASAVVREALSRDGVKFDLSSKIIKVEYSEGVFRVFTSSQEVPHEAEALLVSAGRKPNLEVDLDKADVKFDVRTGVIVNEFLQTSNPDIFAVGDCASRYNFTHVSAQMAIMAVENALLGAARSMSKLLIPWVTYTTPEIGHVGKYANEVPGGVDVYESTFEENDRAILEDAKEGFVKLLCAKGTDRLVGATIVAEHAGEMLHELSVCIQFGVSIGALATVVHSYPTMACAIEVAANKYRTANWKTAKDVPKETAHNRADIAAAHVRAVKAAGASQDEVRKAVEAYIAVRAATGGGPETKTPAPAESKPAESPELVAAGDKVRAVKAANAPQAEVDAAVYAFKLQRAADHVKAVKASGASQEDVKVAVDAYSALLANPPVAKAAAVQPAVAQTPAQPVTQPPAAQAELTLEGAKEKVRQLKAQGASPADVKAAVDAYNALTAKAKVAEATKPEQAEETKAQEEPMSPALALAVQRVRDLKAARAPHDEVIAAVNNYKIERAANKLRLLKESSSATEEDITAATREYEALSQPAVTPTPIAHQSEPAPVALKEAPTTEVEAARAQVRSLKASQAPQEEVKAAVDALRLAEAAAKVRALKDQRAPMEEVVAAVEAYKALLSPSAPVVVHVAASEPSS